MPRRSGMRRMDRQDPVNDKTVRPHEGAAHSGLVSSGARMLHGSIAAHHQERKGRGEQCGTPFPNRRAARMRVWVLEPPGELRELLPFSRNPPAVRLADKPSARRRTAYSAAKAQLELQADQ